MSREHVPEIGGEIWLMRKGDAQGYPSKARRFAGETSRSWLTGPSWRPDKWSKKEYEPISAEEAARISAEREWVHVHRRKIVSRIEYHVNDMATLRQIAALIGYEEGSK